MVLTNAPTDEEVRRENDRIEMERRAELNAEMQRRFEGGRRELEEIARRREQDDRRRAQLELEQLRQIDNLLFERRRH